MILLDKHLEKTYGNAMKGIMFAVNPIKKKILKTHCTVHKFINIQALEILKSEGYEEQYQLYKKYIKNINDGVTWADQDFKSSNHFYHFIKGKGLYGFSDALTEFNKYYKKALGYADAGDNLNCFFYLGAACHLIQDATVPQHVNNKLLKSHRRFELWIISRLMSDYSFVLQKGIKRYDDVEDYIRNNARFANNTFLKYANIKDRNERYGKISSAIIKEAQATTTGFLLDFYQLLHK